METVLEIGKRARAAERRLAISSCETRKEALSSIAAALEAECAAILAANEQDMRAGEAAGLTRALLDRLLLTKERVFGVAEGVREVAAFPDPLGRTLSETLRPNGLFIRKVSVPLGVIAVIYEARPNVTADSAALCLMSGNAVILRGGKEAIHSNTAIVSVMRKAIAGVGLPEDCVQLIGDTSRSSATELMTLNGYVDVLIPRGGRGLIQSVVKNATVPVIETGAGVCHAYVDRECSIEMAADIICNAKVSRPSVCNALECMLIHRDIAPAALPAIAAELIAANVEIRGDKETCALLPCAVPATEEDWGREYGDYIIACRIVSDMEEAIEHIYRYSTFHSECIITADADTAERFMESVDAAAVYVNSSTRFTDGNVFGLGAEIGISTQKLHARGPLGINELTSMKYLIYGNGQTRV